MPSYEVTIERTITQSTSTIIEAENEEAAQEKADALVAELNNAIGVEEAAKYEWQEDEDSFELQEVTEA